MMQSTWYNYKHEFARRKAVNIITEDLVAKTWMSKVWIEQTVLARYLAENPKKVDSIINEIKSSEKREKKIKAIVEFLYFKSTMATLDILRDVEEVKNQIEKTWDINFISSKSKLSVLMFAAMYDNIWIVKNLIELWADKTLRNKNNESAFDIAKAHRSQETILDLLKL